MLTQCWRHNTNQADLVQVACFCDIPDDRVAVLCHSERLLVQGSLCQLCPVRSRLWRQLEGLEGGKGTQEVLCVQCSASNKRRKLTYTGAATRTTHTRMQRALLMAC